MFAKHLNQYKTSTNLNLRNSDSIFYTVAEMSKNKKSYSEVDKLKIMKNLVENYSDIQNKYLSLMFLISIQESKSELKNVVINGDFLEKFQYIDNKNLEGQLENFFLGLEDDVLDSLTKEQIETVLTYHQKSKRDYSFSARHDGYKAKSINLNEFDLFIKINKLNSEYNAFSQDTIKKIIKALATKEGELRSTYFNLINNVVIESDKLYKKLIEEHNELQSNKQENNSEETNTEEHDFVKSKAEIVLEMLGKEDILEFFIRPLLFSSSNISAEKVQILDKLSKVIIHKGDINDYKSNYQKAIDLVTVMKSNDILDKIDSISTDKYFDNIKLLEALDLRINSETVKHFFIENEGWADRVYNNNVKNTIASLEAKELNGNKFIIFKNLALKHFNKKAFLNLLQSTPGEYLSNIDIQNSNLLVTDISEHINVNTLNKETLKTCLETVASPGVFNEFTRTHDLKVMTAQELFFIVELLTTPYAVKKLKEELYFHFIDEKLDERLRLMKALPSSLQYIGGIQNRIEMFEVNSVLEKMKEKSLNELKGYISNKYLSKETNLILFLFKDELPILNEVDKDNNLAFIINNFGLLKENSSLHDLQNDFIANSSEVERFKKLLSVKDESFFDKYFDNLLNFYNNGLVKNSLTYISGLDNRGYHKQQVENFKLLIKAELAGKLQEVKFDKLDLMKELIMNKIDDELAEKWFKNTRIKEGRFTIKESSDFKTLFEMGENPINSCMSYNRGSYNHCLLSIFDSNKKLVTVYDGETLVGRAIVRFTKIKKGAINENGLGFKDIEDEEVVTESNVAVDENEMNDLGIFIERLYTGYDSSQRVVMCNAIVKLMKEKAEDLGVKLYLSSSYDYKGEAVYHSEINVFISHSKNGNQYIDSLGGSQDSMSGGRYVKGRVYEIKLNNELVLS